MSGTRVYIGKVAGVNKEDLENICRSCGMLVDFMLKETYAFAEYSNEYDANKAIMELDGRSIKGVRVVAEYAKSKGDLDQEYFSSHPRIYVGRLPMNITKEETVNQFSQFGEITDILRKDDFAFIEFKEKEAAQEAIQKMHGFTINGNRIVVEGARPKESAVSIACPRLYIGKLGAQVKKQDIINTFGPYGEIVDILMKEDYAFLEFTSNQSAGRALSELNGARIVGSKIIVEEAKPKEGEKTQQYGTGRQQPIKGVKNNSSSTQESQSQNKSKGRRLSPRRSVSRSRSRSQEKRKNQNKFAIKI